jgi:hypothetical protein
VDPLVRGKVVRGTDPDLDLDPDPSIEQNSKKNLDFYCFLTFYVFLSLKNDVNNLQKGMTS